MHPKAGYSLHIHDVKERNFYARRNTCGTEAVVTAHAAQQVHVSKRWRRIRISHDRETA
jgi:hypothetical protein